MLTYISIKKCHRSNLTPNYARIKYQILPQHPDNSLENYTDILWVGCWVIKISVRLVYEYPVPGCGIVPTLTGTSQYVTAKVTVYVEAKLLVRLINPYPTNVENRVSS